MPELADKDACDLLDADHLAVKHLFVAYALAAYSPEAAGSSERARLAATLCDELTVHAQIEEEIFYPALQDALDGAGDVLHEAREDHAYAKTLIERIRQTDPADEAMDQLVAALAVAVEDHVKEERDELFPKARAAAGLDLRALGQQLKERQQALQRTAASAA